MANRTQIANFYFHKEEDTPSEGKALRVQANYETLNIGILGNPTSINFTVEAKSFHDEDYKAIQAVNLINFDVSDTFNESDGNYSVDLTGLISVRVRINSLTGKADVVGRVVY